jgi:hypothetical protein
VEALSAQWDRQCDAGDHATRRATLNALRERLLERNYINNLLATIDREVANLGPVSLGTDAPRPEPEARRPESETCE